MSIFLIAGQNDCPNYAHALHVAQYLETHLPNFKYRQIEKEAGEFERWVESVNSENGWHIVKGPLIWKEITKMGGKPYLIGSISEFWEYCYDYYGFQSKISKAELSKIIADNLFIQSRTKCRSTIHIMIYGAANPLLEFVIIEIQDNIKLEDNESLKIYLYEKNLGESEDKMEFLMDVVENMEAVLGGGVVQVVTSFYETLEKCDLLIITQDFSKKTEEITDDWLYRCKTNMSILAEDINSNAKRTLRVILCHHGPVCFNASILVENCTTIRLANIVAVTADEGIPAIEFISRKTGVPVEMIGCPPVWGFSGIMSFIDVGGIIIKSHVYRPFSRTLKIRESSNLPKGTVKCELRVLSYLVECDEEIQATIEERKEQIEMSRKKPVMVKAKALGSLVRLWFAKDRGDEIISLGVCSNESFGFPSGVIFSQAAILNERDLWEPFTNYPISMNAREKIQEMHLEVSDVLEKFDIGHNNKGQ